jgi:PKD repeat protein
MQVNGQPTTDTLASVEVDNQRGTALLYRTVPVGNPAPAPPQVWPLSVTAVGVTDSFFNITNSIEINSMMNLYATLHNNFANQYEAIVTGTVFDGNLIPISALSSQVTMGPYQNVSVSWSVSIPEWAYSGEALAVINVFNDYPVNGGTPMIPETPYVFYLTSNSLIPTPSSVLPAANTSATGQYRINFRMPPDIYTVPGTYNVYATAVSPSSHLSSTASASFTLDQDPSPPQAAFSYSPLLIYGGENVTFDGSSSSAEGTGVTITQYAWTINSILQTAGTSPYMYYTFPSSGTYLVQLNVTNSVGLWSTTEKPVIVSPDFGPTANFTWTPPSPGFNVTVNFDASSSQLGWSSLIPGYANITSYKWNFGDGTTNTTSTNTTTHVFTQAGNYTVTLTVTDSESRTSQSIQTVQISSYQPWDVNQDGVCNMKDIAIVARAFGSKPGSSNWNPAADVNFDGVVNMKDIAIVARAFGKTD